MKLYLFQMHCHNAEPIFLFGTSTPRLRNFLPAMLHNKTPIVF